MENIPLVSAICITNDRTDLLKRSITCFLAQTYAHKELIVAFPADDPATADLLKHFSSPMIKPFPIENAVNITLGQKRNMGIEQSSGTYFCTWDDDDWFHPRRIAAQVDFVLQKQQRSCALSKILVYDSQEGAAYQTFSRPWEGSLLCERSAISEHVRFGDMDRGEDSVLVCALQEKGWLDTLNNPMLYIYVYHGRNTCDRDHWVENIMSPGIRLPRETATFISGMLQFPEPVESQSAELERVFQEIRFSY
ncbi:MAG TPA: glycosyltransferase family A protein [Ohtaekwangia sp.]|nr:glycosyltransferase family A protein [Ohtaekwangia sp.]